MRSSSPRAVRTGSQASGSGFQVLSSEGKLGEVCSGHRHPHSLTC